MMGLAYFAPKWNPVELSGFFAAIMGLGFPILLGLNLFFIIFWLFARKVYFLISLITIVLGWGFVQRTLVFDFKGAVETEKQTLKVMSYNVQNFDLYNWTDNEVSRNNMLKLIRDENPEVIAFQEFYTEEDEYFHNIKMLVNELGYDYYYFEKTLTLKETNHWGLAVFSKYPLSNKTAIPLQASTTNIITYCDITMPDKRTVRLFNVHLQSIGLANKDLKYLKEITETKPDAEASKSLKRIAAKLKSAFAKRGKQSDILHDAIKQSQTPVIVCGDFNDTPLSYTYQNVRKGLKDSFIEAGNGLGVTYAGPLPLLRIDYVFTDSLFNTLDFHVIDKKYSDHYPISAVIEFP